jgi:hypothetical protein
MIDAAIWLPEVCSAVAPNHQQAFRKINIMLAANTINAFADGFGNCGGQALPLLAWPVAWLVDKPRELCVNDNYLSLIMGFEAHDLTLSKRMAGAWADMGKGMGSRLFWVEDQAQLPGAGPGPW